MRIRINGETREVGKDQSLSALLVELGIDPGHVAVEHNDVLLQDRADWPELRLQPEDRLEIVRFVGGG